MLPKNYSINFQGYEDRTQSERKVNFLIAGTQKGGTSALNAYLDAHPEACMANRKEVHFFDNKKYFLQNKVDYSFYHSFFSPEPEHRLIGEATPIYMYWHEAPKRIWQYNPQMKIIILLRNPVERAFSHWNMARIRNKETLSFDNAIMHEQQRCREALPYQHRDYSYVDRGFYVDQIRRVWQFFPKEQTLILKSEGLKNDPQKTLDTIFSFLGLRCPLNIGTIDVHSRPYIYSLDEKEKAYLNNIYEFEIKNLERVLGWDCSDWLS